LAVGGVNDDAGADRASAHRAETVVVVDAHDAGVDLGDAGEGVATGEFEDAIAGFEEAAVGEVGFDVEGRTGVDHDGLGGVVVHADETVDGGGGGTGAHAGGDDAGHVEAFIEGAAGLLSVDGAAVDGEVGDGFLEALQVPVAVGVNRDILSVADVFGRVGFNAVTHLEGRRVGGADVISDDDVAGEAVVGGERSAVSVGTQDEFTVVDIGIAGVGVPTVVEQEVAFAGFGDSAGAGDVVAEGHRGAGIRVDGEGVAAQIDGLGEVGRVAGTL